MVAPLVAAAAKTAAKQGAKKVAKQGAKNLTKKQLESRAIQNKRRSLKYYENKLKLQAEKQAGFARQETLDKLKTVQSAIDSSYFDKKLGKYNTTSSKLEKVQKQTREYRREYFKQTRELTEAENLRITEMKKQEMRYGRTETQIANNEPLTNEQKLKRAEANFFYQHTKVFWQGGSDLMRAENVVEAMKSYGLRLESGKPVQNLADAYQFIKEKYASEYPTMERVENGEFNENESEQKEDSPPPISRKQFRAWAAK